MNSRLFSMFTKMYTSLAKCVVVYDIVRPEYQLLVTPKFKARLYTTANNSWHHETLCLRFKCVVHKVKRNSVNNRLQSKFKPLYKKVPHIIQFSLFLNFGEFIEFDEFT